MTRYFSFPFGAFGSRGVGRWRHPGRRSSGRSRPPLPPLGKRERPLRALLWSVGPRLRRCRSDPLEAELRGTIRNPSGWVAPASHGPAPRHARLRPARLRWRPYRPDTWRLKRRWVTLLDALALNGAEPCAYSR